MTTAKLYERLFYFKLSDGNSGMYSIEDARALNDPEANSRIESILLNLKNKKMLKDGFEPGWQENIGEYCGGRKEYEKKLKEKGLVEIGYDYIPQDTTTQSNQFANEEVIKSVIESGVDLTGNEIEALKSGEYFKDIELDLE